MTLEEELEDALNQEIVRELIVEVNPEVTDAEVTRIWGFCNGNPWSAKALYQMVKMREVS